MRGTFLIVLMAANCLMAGVSIWLWTDRARPASDPQPDSTASKGIEVAQAKVVPPQTKTVVAQAPTPFRAVYSSRPRDLAANLRRVGCPEETVKDILMAEIGRRYANAEKELKPTPADHIPWGWSIKTSEAKLLERRQRAAAIAREKEATLRSALGYAVKVPMPLYAMTVSDQQFQVTLSTMPPEHHEAAFQAQEQYWMQVEQLRSRTRGFWESTDIEELNTLKEQRQQALESLAPPPEP